MYIALKPIRFDKDYCVGEPIPDKVVDPKMEATLIKRGRIAKVDEPTNMETPVTPDPAATVTSADGESGTSDDAEGETSDGAEGDDETDGDHEPEVTEPEAAETANLDNMKKDDLLKHAKAMGLEVNDKMTKDVIKKMILDAQQGGEADE